MSDKREPCCTVSFSGSEHFPKCATWYVTWLPKGYAPTSSDRLVCALPDPTGEWSNYGLRAGERPPLIEALVKTIEEFFKERK